MAAKPGTSTVKYKLFIAFLLAFTAVGSAVYFSYNSFNQLLSSVKTLSSPNESVEILQDVMNQLQDADVDLRNYMMTMDDSVLESYTESMESIRDDLEELKQLRSFDDSRGVLDSLNQMFQEKADLMYALVTFKNSSEYNQMAEKAMGKISKSMEQEKAQPVTEITRNTNSDPGIKSTPVENQSASADEDSKKKKKEKKNDEGFLRNIFSGKSKPDNPEVTTIVKLTDTSTSTSTAKFNIDENPSIDMADVRQILVDLDKEQKQYDFQLTKRELEILASDKVIMNNLKEMLDRIQREEKLSMDAQFFAAGQSAEQSSRIILYILAGALLFGLMFLVVIVNDINKSNRYKLQLEEARVRAEQLARAKEEFLANMSHEIRTPLNAIIGFSEQLTQTPLHTTQKNYLRAVQQAGTHLLNTVNDILDITKIESGKLPLEEKPFRMKEIIEEVVSIMEIKAQEKSLKMEFSADATCDQYVVGDSFRIMQILYNLTGNAIKFTESGYIRIECTGTEKNNAVHFKIDVIDTGIGIEQEKLNLIFDTFTQADTATTRKFGGTGLGLSISKKLAEFMKGQILVKSETNIGSVFTLSIPLPVAKENEIETAKLETSTDKNLSGLQILIVDDEPYNLMLSEVILKKHGAKTTTANSGRDALDKMDVQYFDIILADLQMPEIDGYMLAKKIRERFVDVPLIALTANVMQGETDIIRKVGFNGILLKPYKEHELLKMISDYSPVVIGVNQNEVAPVSPEVLNGMALYNLNEVKQFTDNDQATLISVIESFVDNNKINLKNLAAFIEDNDITGIRNTAHKMLPSYNHFKVHDLISELKYLETLQILNPAELSKLMRNIESVSNQLFLQLEKEIAYLKQEVHV